MTAPIIIVPHITKSPNRRKRDRHVRPQTEDSAGRLHMLGTGVHKTSTGDVIAITVNKITAPYTKGDTNHHGIIKEERTC